MNRTIAALAIAASVVSITLSDAQAEPASPALPSAPVTRPKLVQVVAFGSVLQPLTADGSRGMQVGVGGEVRIGRYSRFLQIDSSLNGNGEDNIFRASVSFNQRLGKLYIGGGLGLSGSFIGQWSGETSELHAQVGAHLFRILGRRTTLQVRGVLSSVLFDSATSETLGVARPEGASRPEIVGSFGLVF